MMSSHNNNNNNNSDTGSEGESSDDKDREQVELRSLSDMTSSTENNENENEKTTEEKKEKEKEKEEKKEKKTTTTTTMLPPHGSSNDDATEEEDAAGLRCSLERTALDITSFSIDFASAAAESEPSSAAAGLLASGCHAVAVRLSRRLPILYEKNASTAQRASQHAVVEALGLADPKNLRKAVFVSVGGADGLGEARKAYLVELYKKGIVDAAARQKSILLTGGTDSGMMAVVGQAVQELRQERANHGATAAAAAATSTTAGANADAAGADTANAGGGGHSRFGRFRHHHQQQRGGVARGKSCILCSEPDKEIPYLLGVCPASMVSYPGNADNDLPTPNHHFPKRTPLEPNSSHVCIVGDTRNFGDEATTMFALADELGRMTNKRGNPRVVGFLSNGGTIAAMEVNYMIKMGIPVIVLKGTGRLADEVSDYREDKKQRNEIKDDKLRNIVESSLVHVFDITDSMKALRKLIFSLLKLSMKKHFGDKEDDMTDFSSSTMTSSMSSISEEEKKREDQYRTPLTKAVRDRSLEGVRQLIAEAKTEENKRMLVNSMEHNGISPLFLACSNGDLDIMRELLFAGADIFHRNSSGETCLRVAAAEGHLLVVKEILRHECDMQKDPRCAMCEDFFLRSIKDYTQSGPVDAAAANGHEEVVRALLQDGRYMPSQSETLRMIRYTPLALHDYYDKCVHVDSKRARDDANFYSMFYYERTTLGNLVHCSQVLEAIVTYRRTELLRHPLVSFLMDKKWKRYCWIYYVNFSFYLLFLALLTSFGFGGYQNNGSALGYVVAALSVLRILFELREVYSLRLRYFFDMNDLMEVYIYLSAMLLGFGVVPEGSWLYLMAFTVVIAWLNMLVFARHVRLWNFGLYSLMFLNVVKTFTRVIVMYATLLVAFALGFRILFMQRASVPDQFNFPVMMHNVFYAMYAQYFFLMDDVLNDSHATIPEALMEVIFLILMPLLFGNLLIGLAVGDIEKIRQNATFRHLSLRANFIANVDAFCLGLEDWYEWHVKMHNQGAYPNRRSVWYKRLMRLLNFAEGECEQASLPLPLETDPESEANKLLASMLRELCSNVSNLSRSVAELKADSTDLKREVQELKLQLQPSSS